MAYKSQSFELTQRLKKHVYVLSDEIGDRSVFRYQSLKQAENYIVEAFASFGYEPELQEYEVQGKTVNNIIAVKKGATKPEEIIIVGAHYDSCSNPGADDNASGISGLIELARDLKDKPTSRTIKFIAFVNEEPPFFHTENMGSRIYAKVAKKKTGRYQGSHSP